VAAIVRMQLQCMTDGPSVVMVLSVEEYPRVLKVGSSNYAQKILTPV
jgi:hypothetical protein